MDNFLIKMSIQTLLSPNPPPWLKLYSDSVTTRNLSYTGSGNVVGSGRVRFYRRFTNLNTNAGNNPGLRIDITVLGGVALFAVTPAYDIDNLANTGTDAAIDGVTITADAACNYLFTTPNTPADQTAILDYLRSLFRNQLYKVKPEIVYGNGISCDFQLLVNQNVNNNPILSIGIVAGNPAGQALKPFSFILPLE